jgi:hypothetical protein
VRHLATDSRKARNETLFEYLDDNYSLDEFFTGTLVPLKTGEDFRMTVINESSLTAL